MKYREVELRQFAYVASHDLKAPARRAHLLAQMISSDYDVILDEEGKYILQRLRDSLSSMGLLITGVLDISQIGFNKSDLVPVDLKELVESLTGTSPIPSNFDVLITDELPVLRPDVIRVRQIF